MSPPDPSPAKPAARPPLMSVVGMYATSKAYVYALRIVSGFVRPLLLSPELFGLWNLLALVIQYATYYLHLGCVTAMRFRLPYEWGRGNEAEGERIKGAVWLGSLVPYLVVSAAVLVAAAALVDQPPEVRAGLATVGLMVVMVWYQNWLVQILQARQTFAPITTVGYIGATVALTTSVPLILLWGIYGVYVSALVTQAVNLLYLHRHFREPVTEPFRWPVYRALTRQGFPIMAFDMASMLVRTGDRLLIGALLGTEQLGYYALAAFIFGILLEIPGVVREVLEPRMMEALSGIDDRTALETYLFKPMLNTAFYIPFLIGPAVLVAPFIDVVLPKYQPGVLPAQVLAVGGYFLAISFVVRGIIVANDWQGRALGPILAAAVVNAAGSAIVIAQGGGIVGVSVVSGLSYVLLLGLLLRLVARHHPARDAPWGRVLAGLLLPFGAMTAGLVGLLAAQEWLELNRWLAAVLQGGLFALAMLAVIVLGRRWLPEVAPPSLSPLLTRLRRRRGARPPAG